MREIALGRSEYVTLVSDEDYEWVTQWKWCKKQSSRKWKNAIYARRTKYIAGFGKVTLYLAHQILIERMGQQPPGERYEVDHIDGNSLNNTRENLRWLPTKANRSRKYNNQEYAEAA